MPRPRLWRECPDFFVSSPVMGQRESREEVDVLAVFHRLLSEWSAKGT